MSEQKEVTFEEAIKQLEGIVEKLEEGEVPLEKAISYFKEGMSLSKVCHEKLQYAEKEMHQILREDGELESFIIQEDEDRD